MNGRRGQAGRDLRGHLVQAPCSSRAVPEHRAQDLSRLFWGSSSETTPHPLWTIRSSAQSLPREEVPQFLPVPRVQVAGTSKQSLLHPLGFPLRLDMSSFPRGSDAASLHPLARKNQTECFCLSVTTLKTSNLLGVHGARTALALLPWGSTQASPGEGLRADAGP